MKNIFTLFAVSILICIVAAANTGDKFIESLRNCSLYNESGSLNIGGIQAHSAKQIIGWQDNKCVYKEIINYSSTNIITVCKFTQPQIRDIILAAESYYSTLNNSENTPNSLSFESVQNNPFAMVMNRYLQDTSICTMNSYE
jgi:hypothetical protein